MDSILREIKHAGPKGVDKGPIVQKITQAAQRVGMRVHLIPTQEIKHKNSNDKRIKLFQKIQLKRSKKFKFEAEILSQN